MCIISGLREELLDSSILVAAMSSLFESVSGLHGGLVLRKQCGEDSHSQAIRVSQSRSALLQKFRHGRCLHLGTCQSCSRAVSRPLTGLHLN